MLEDAIRSGAKAMLVLGMKPQLAYSIDTV